MWEELLCFFWAVFVEPCLRQKIIPLRVLSFVACVHQNELKVRGSRSRFVVRENHETSAYDFTRIFLSVANDHNAFGALFDVSIQILQYCSPRGWLSTHASRTGAWLRCFQGRQFTALPILFLQVLFHDVLSVCATLLRFLFPFSSARHALRCAMICGGLCVAQTRHDTRTRRESHANSTLLCAAFLFCLLSWVFFSFVPVAHRT